MRDLSVAEQQMVEIARALSMKSRLIVMDEPTSALSRRPRSRSCSRIVRDLKAQGLSIIFVTHRLEEVFEICDRYTVLRDGRQVGSGAVAETDIDGIIRHDGRARRSARSSRSARRAAPGEVALAVEGLSRRGNAQDQNATVLDDVSLEVRRGEILGIAGLVGAGRTEMARAIFGADPFDSGRVLVDGEPVDIRSPRDAIRHGIGLVPEDRKQQALFLSLAIRTNLSAWPRSTSVSALALLRRRGGRRRALVEEFRKTLNIRMASPEQLVVNLSGGNQQKVVLARWLALRPEGPDRRRADARHRRRRQGRGAQPPVRDGAQPASPSSPSPRSCRRSWRSATASSPCARAASPARSPATRRTRRS